MLLITALTCEYVQILLRNHGIILLFAQPFLQLQGFLFQFEQFRFQYLVKQRIVHPYLEINIGFRYPLTQLDYFSLQ